MKRYLDILVGRTWGQRVVIGATVAVYAGMLVTDPAAAVRSAERAIGTFVRLFTLIVASLLLASALEQLLPRETVVRYLGRGTGPRNAVLAGLLGGVLLGGPYATYPIMESVYRSGAGYTALVAMYVGYGVIGLGRVPFGLVIFSPEIVAIRLAFAVVLTVLAALFVWAVVPERDLEASAGG